MFTAQHVGEYQFCFNNEMSTFAEKFVDFEIAVCAVAFCLSRGQGGGWQRGKETQKCHQKNSSWTFPPGPHLSPLPLPASYLLRNKLIEPTRLMGFLSGFYRSRTKNALSCRRDLGRVPNRRRRWRSQFSSCLRSCRRFLGTRSTSGRAKIATSARCGARRDGFSTLV